MMSNLNLKSAETLINLSKPELLEYIKELHLIIYEAQPKDDNNISKAMSDINKAVDDFKTLRKK